jgi:hypothetical protein
VYTVQFPSVCAREASLNKNKHVQKDLLLLNNARIWVARWAWLTWGLTSEEAGVAEADLVKLATDHRSGRTKSRPRKGASSWNKFPFGVSQEAIVALDPRWCGDNLATWFASTCASNGCVWCTSAVPTAPSPAKPNARKRPRALSTGGRRPQASKRLKVPTTEGKDNGVLPQHDHAHEFVCAINDCRCQRFKTILVAVDQWARRCRCG